MIEILISKTVHGIQGGTWRHAQIQRNRFQISKQASPTGMGLGGRGTRRSFFNVLPKRPLWSFKWDSAVFNQNLKTCVVF